MAQLEADGLYKRERVMTTPQGAWVEADGKRVINLCANNYLGLSGRPELVKAAQEALPKHDFGLSSVRFICGTQDVHKALEGRLSAFLGFEDTILFGSCFDANGGVFEALLFGEDPPTVQRWVRRFEERGFEGLREGERPGRPRSLDERQWARLERDLCRDPRDFGHLQNHWDGKVLPEHLKRRYGVSLGVRQCQRIFNQMGFQLRKPRSLTASGSPSSNRHP